MNRPTGTLTFLFTDIEGSTKLWEEQSDTMRLALARHDALLRAAIETNGGTVFKTIGDAFCAAFPTAHQALDAALMAQQSLQRVKAGGGSDLMLKVRMALLTGAAEQRDGDYFGQPLNRVARLLAAGHGGQVLLSQTTYDLTRDLLPTNAALKDLGEHRLRDLHRPEQVHQLLHPDLPSDFSPLRSLNNPNLPNNLPQLVTSFVGREKEMAEIKTLLSKTRLLTLSGSGGTGKTRLSLQVAAEVLASFPDGVWLVELASLVDSTLVPQTVAEVLGIRELPGEPILKTLLSALKDKQMLLVLDNCEHMLDAAARLVDGLLKSCPKVRLLVSSREALGITGEHAYRVPSLSLPDLKTLYTPQSLSQYEAVRLFIERAVAVKGDFTVTNQNAPSVASVCYRLDGIPLAIELAAARVRSMTVEELGMRLGDRFRILTGGSRTALPRQQTLRSMIDWSYDLLEENQKALLVRLCVFAGGWTSESAEQVCSGGVVEEWVVLDLLTALIDKSLVIAEEQGEKTRYRLLETVRQYARERLAADTEGFVYRRKHRDYFLTLAEQTRSKLFGPEQAHWLEVLETEHDNLRQALTMCLEETEGGEEGLWLGAALQQFWRTRGYLGEGRERFAALLSHPLAQKYTKAHANALNGAGTLAFYQGDYTSARSLYEQSLAVRRELGDKRGIANSLMGSGIVAKDQGDYASAHSLYEECLAIFRELGDKAGIASSLGNLGNLASDQSDYTSARPLYEESLEICRELGNKQGVSYSLGNLGNVAKNQGDYTSARSLHEQSLAVFQELGDKRGIANTLMNLGNLARVEGNDDSARSLYKQSLDIFRELGDQLGMASSLNNLGIVASTQGDYVSARAYYEESLVIRREIRGRSGIAEALEACAGLMAVQKQPERATRLWGAAEALRQEIGAPIPPNEREQYDRDVAAARQALGEESYSAAWAEGQAMTLEQAIELALEKPDA